MGFLVELSAKSWRHADSGPERTYLVTWDGSGNTSTALARNAVLEHLHNVVEDQSTGAIRDLTKSPHGTPSAPGTIASTELRARAMLHGYPLLSMSCEEIAATFGKRYEAVVRYGLQNRNAQSPASLSVGVRIADDADASVELSRNMSVTLRPREIDYATLIGLLRRNTTTSQNDPNFQPPFPLGSINAERTSLEGRVVVNGLQINTPKVDYTVDFAVSGAYPNAAFVEAVTDAAKAGVTNSDTFTLGGIQYQPKELLLVSADFGASASTTERIANGSYDFDSASSSVITVGFAIGRRTSLVVEEEAGEAQTRKSVMTGLVHGANGGAAPEFYWQDPLLPATATVGSDELFYIGPHDYAWRFASDTLSEGVVTSEIEWVSIHSPFASQSFGNLFGGTAL